MKILFVCHGNICRSPMAEFVMKDLLAKAGRDDVAVESAALRTDEIGSDTHYGTKRELARHGIPFAPRRAWLLAADRVSEYDLVIGMDGANMRDLRRLAGEGAKFHKPWNSRGASGMWPTRGTRVILRRRTRMWLMAAPRCLRSFRSRSLRMFTFPWVVNPLKGPLRVSA